MRNLMFILAAVLFCSFAQAATLNCQGSTFGYQFALAGTTEGNQIVTDLNIAVRSPTGSVEQGTLKVVSSNIEPGVVVSFKGENEETVAVLDAPAVGDHYEGTLQVQSRRGNVNVGSTCTLQ
jgi:hypothetical protein